MTDNVRPFKSRGNPKPPPLDADLGDCPVVCLGENAGTYFFLSKSGELRALAFREMSRNGVMSLFGGETDWLKKAAPDEKSQWATGPVVAFLMRSCARAGIFDPATEGRGLGVWPAEVAGGVIAHCGDRLWVGSGWEKPGTVVDGAIYGAGPGIEPPDFDNLASTEVGEKLRADLGNWNFRRKPALELLLGYIGCAALGAVGDWHPHALVVGEAGSGKTALVKFAAAMLGDQAVHANNLTGPALYQAFTNTARCFLFDEQDDADDGGPSRIQAVIDILRQISSGDGAGIIRGGSGGAAKRYSVVGSALMAGINAVILRPEDRSRISEIDLAVLPKRAEGEADFDLAAAMEWARAASASLRARCILRVGQFRQAFATYRAALIRANCNRRQADQLAALLAGRDILLYDDPPHPDFAEGVVAAVDPLILEVQVADAEESDGHLCWTALMTSPIEAWQGGERRVLSDLTIASMKEPSAAADQLGAYGLRLDLTGDLSPAILVANNHQALERIFAGTRWAKGKWRRSLGRLPGAVAHPTPERFKGIKQRCVRVPVDLLPMKDAGYNPKPRDEESTG